MRSGINIVHTAIVTLAIVMRRSNLKPSKARQPLAIALAFFVALATLTMSSTEAQTTAVNFAYFPALVDTPVFVANAEGIFKKNGLEVQMIPFTSGPAQMAALLSGSTQFADGGGGLLTFPQVAKGYDIRGVSNFWATNFYTLVVRSNMPTPHAGQPFPKPMLDLKGKRVGVTALGSLTAAMVETMARDAGLQPGKDITILPAGAVSTAIAALTSGQIDAYLSYPPINEILEAKYPGSYKVLIGGDQYPPLLKVTLLNHVVTTQGYIDKNPIVVHAMCKSIQESLQWIKNPANFNATVDILERALPGNPKGVMAAALRDALPAMIGDGENLGKIPAEAIAHADEQLVGLGFIPKAVSPSLYVYKPCN